MQAHELTIETPLTVDHVSDHARSLSEAIESHEEVNVDLSACEGIDVPGAQLLISAAKTARQRGVQLHYRNAERYRRICEYAGLKAKGLSDS